MRIDLARFFRVTRIVLVFVAAGLCGAAVRSAHEAGRPARRTAVAPPPQPGLGQGRSIGDPLFDAAT